MARDHGADGIILSNHGGRQLDYAMAPLRVLPEIASRKGDMKVIIDGGIRRGSDVLKALALGADFTLMGRPFLFAAAYDGQRGVEHAYGIMRDEIMRDMAMLGVNSVEELNESFVRKACP